MGKGALVFKGDKPKKKKKKSKHGVQGGGNGETSHDPQPSPSSLGAGSSPASPPRPSAAVAPAAPKIQKGAGKITTSGTVVSGHDGTQFLRQLKVGDALMVGDQMRVVTMCLSNTSVNVSSAFAENLVTPTVYSYIQKPKNKASAAAKVAASRKEAEDAAAASSGTYGSNSELVYREKTENGSYRIIKKQLDHEATRGSLLEMRTKKKSDKYC